jgi:hypothetical protein
MLPNRQALVSGLISVLMGGAALCLPMAAHAGDWTIKSGTSAENAGKCLTNIMLFAEISKDMLDKETPEYDAMAKAWIDYIEKGDEDFAEVAVQAMSDTATRYDGLTKTEESDGLLAILISDMTGCLDFMMA